MTLKFFEKLLFFGDFSLFQKDGISDNDMLEEHQRPERGKMLIQVAKLKVPREHLLFVSKAAVRIYETHTGSRTELQAFPPQQKKVYTTERIKLFLGKNEIWI